MRVLFLVLLLAGIFAFFIPSVQARLRTLLHGHPRAIWALPVLLTAIFTFGSVIADAFSWSLAAAILIYTAAPVLCAALQPAENAKRPTVLDFVAVLLLWLPIEFAAGAVLVPKPAQGFLHSVAYAIAILLGLSVFIGYRSLPGLKYNPPRSVRVFWLPFAGFLLTAPVLIAIGIPIGFIPSPHMPLRSAGSMAAGFGIVFAGTALPEEILFRSLIQNMLMLRFGETGRVLLAASFIFGCAHLDNGPQPLPNWRYMILATIAGIAYGKVFQKSSSVTSSALLHTLVDWTKHFFF